MKSACAYCDTLFNAGDSTADTGTSRSGQAASTERGKQIFSEYGAACHIVSAKGNVPAATALRISPADLTTPALQNSGSRYRRIAQGNLQHGRLCIVPEWLHRTRNLDPQLTTAMDRVRTAARFTDHILMFKENPARLVGQLSRRSVRGRNLSYTHRF